MREKVVPAVFLMLVLLIGFPSSTIDFSAFADEEDDYDDDYDDDRSKDDKKKDKKENKNLKVSAEESKAYQKQKEKAEKAREKAEERKEKLKEKYEKQKEKLREKVQKSEEKLKEKYERELKKFEDKVNRLDKDDDYDDDYITEFDDDIEIAFRSLSATSTTLCHYPPGNPSNAKTITVGTPAARAHLAHGDKLGACGEDIEIDLEERDYKLAKKHLKLEELRSKFEQKQIELAQKFSDKIQKLETKYAEKQEKRAAKLLEKIESGEYYKDFIDEDAQIRKFVLSFDDLEADPIGQPSEISSFSGSVTLKTSSSTDTRGTTKFIVDECNLTNGDVSYSCEYGKARTTSSGPGGEKDSLVIIATLDGDDLDKRTGLKLSIDTDEDIRAIEEGSFDITVHSPQSKITHEWFLGGQGTMTVTTEGSNDT